MAENRTELICINCPRGCLLTIEKQGDQLNVSGHYCNNGIAYAEQEITNPVRVLTVLMKPEGTDKPLSVRTDKPVPKDMLKKCASEIYKVHPKLPIKYGEVLISDICGTGANVIATIDME